MKKRRKNFTLVELLVAMLVFSIMLVMMMRLFTGAQRVWTASNEKNQVFTNARVAMDMLSTMVQSIYYSSNGGGKFYFRIVQNVAPKTDRIYFVSKTDYNLPGKDKIRFLSFQVPNQFDSHYTGESKYKDYYNQLVMTVVCDAATSIDFYNTGDTVYALWFPEYIKSNGEPETFENKSKSLYDLLDTKIISDKTGADYCRSVLLSNVVGFRIRTPDEKEGEERTTASQVDAVPNYIEIRLQLLSSSKFKVWDELVDAGKTTEAETFRKNNQYEFSRRVYIGDRWSN